MPEHRAPRAGLDFTSALYLGLRHPSAALTPWTALTAGAPAALCIPEAARQVGRALASLMGQEAAALAPSTLHVFLDLFEALPPGRATVLADDGLYPIGRWGVERAAARGVPVRWFARHNAAALERSVRTVRGSRRPVVVTDGWDVRVGRFAPLRAYARLAARAGGQLVVDDTQALGVFGARADGAVYGLGGGGAARWFGLRDALVVASLAKGFGVPLAVLAGPAKAVRWYETTAATRVHCSSPSAAHLAAAARALALNTRRGDARRQRLATNVARFRQGLSAMGLAADMGPFPVQHIRLGSGAPRVHAALAARGVRAVLLNGDADPTLAFVLTAAHRGSDIDHALRSLAAALPPRRAARPLDP